MWLPLKYLSVIAYLVVKAIPRTQPLSHGVIQSISYATMNDYKNGQNWTRQAHFSLPNPTRRGRLRSSTSSLLDVRPSRCVTVGDRSFATAGPRLWNSLLADVRSASLLTTFRRKLKTHLFRQSYPDIVLSLYTSP